MRPWLSVALKSSHGKALSPSRYDEHRLFTIHISFFPSISLPPVRERHARLTRLQILAKRHHSSHVPMSLFSQFQRTSDVL